MGQGQGQGMKQIGIYGGSFDPIHIGHLNLAIAIKEAHGLDEVWLCPSSLNPNKLFGSRENAQHRLNMLHLAIEDIPWMHVTEVELDRPGPSYTIDTLKQLVDGYSGDRFSLILGDDSARDFHTWRQPDDILNYAPLLVGRRSIDSKEAYQGSAKVVNAIKKGLTLTPIMEVASTQIRDRISEGLYCGHLVPLKVLDYIISNHLYSSPHVR